MTARLAAGRPVPRVREWLGTPLSIPLSRRERAALLGGFAFLVMLRLPAAWAHGRFLGEEGTIFFAYAWHRPAGEAMWRSFAGYLNLGANATTLLAARLVRDGVPLEAAPWLTMTMALAVQLVPAALLVTTPAAWLPRRGTLAAALLTLALAPMTEEVFTNVLHIQFHLTLAAALLLAFDVPRTFRRRITDAALLVAAPLCGPGAIVLLPFFAGRALIDRDRGRVVQAAVLASGAALQLVVFFTPNPVRGQLLGPAALAAIGFVRLVALPFAGPWLGGAVGTGVYHSFLAGGSGWRIGAAAMAGYAGWLLAASLRRDAGGAARWLIAPGLTLAAVSFGGGMIATAPSEWFNVGTAERYQYLPLVLVTLGLIARSATSATCRWLVGLTLAWGAAGFFLPIPAVGIGPHWLDEVAAWRRDHRRPLATWPAAWTVDLSDRDRPCPPAHRPSRAAPTYCEAAWLQHVADDAALVRAGAGAAISPSPPPIAGGGRNRDAAR